MIWQCQSENKMSTNCYRFYYKYNTENKWFHGYTPIESIFSRGTFASNFSRDEFLSTFHRHRIMGHWPFCFEALPVWFTLSCSMFNLLSSHSSFADYNRFSSWISLNFATFILPSITTSQRRQRNIPTAWFCGGVFNHHHAPHSRGGVFRLGPKIRVWIRSR